MHQLPEVQIVGCDVTHGYGLSVLNYDSQSPKFLLPIRFGHIYFAQFLDQETIIIVADEGSYLGPGFIAKVDIHTGKIIQRSSPFKISGSGKYFFDKDLSIFVASRSEKPIMVWDLESFDLIFTANLLIDRGDHYQLDRYEQYYLVKRIDGEIQHIFHDKNRENEFKSLKKQNKISFLGDMRGLLGITNNKHLILPIDKQVKIPDETMPLGFKIKKEPDGFLAINVKDWRGTHKKKHDEIINTVENEAHNEIYDDQFTLYGIEAAKIKITVKEKSETGFTEAFKDLVKLINAGVENLRFGNCLEVVFIIDEKELDEKEISEAICYYWGDDLCQAIGSVIQAYNESLENSHSNDQLYWKDEEDGEAALCYLVKTYIRKKNMQLDIIRQFVNDLDSEHTNRDFLNIFTFNGLWEGSEEHLRAAIFCGLPSEYEYHGNFNKDNLLDQIAKYFTPKQFMDIFEDEVSKMAESFDSPSDYIKSSRRNLLSALRDVFDVELREILSEKLNQ